MSILKYFKNTPGRPPIGRQALSVIFFFKFATRSLEKKGGPVGRPVGRPAHGHGRGLSPPPRATGGACRPPSGDRGKPLYIRSNPPLPSSFESENSTKN